MDAKPVKLHASLSFVRRRIAGKLCPMYSHSPLYSVTYYVGRVEGEASVPRVVRKYLRTSTLRPDERRNLLSFSTTLYCVLYANGELCQKEHPPLSLREGDLRTYYSYVCSIRLVGGVRLGNGNEPGR